MLSQLYVETRDANTLDPDTVHLFLQEAGVEDLVARRQAEAQREGAVVSTRRKPVKPRGANQIRYVERIRQHDVNFGIGPAGTGKTYLGVACAVEALEKKER
ncbi:MAG: hypothetical protein Ct9H300mP8_00110 [Gammaproteobacteria bacterium]|nr:MAG: hypothetical protein Ct9H300mP8_00110 [Gammaproteobacteria bacterium]